MWNNGGQVGQVGQIGQLGQIANPVYANPQAWAHDVLNQEFQRTAFNNFVELCSLKTMLSQGHMMFCVPCGGPGGGGGGGNNILTATGGQSWSQPLQPASPPVLQTTGQGPMPCIQPNLVLTSRPDYQKTDGDECVFGPHKIDIKLDLSAYAPCEVKVNIESLNCIEIVAKHVGKEINKTFSRRYVLPASINLQLAKCSLTTDYVFLFSAPWNKTQ